MSIKDSAPKEMISVEQLYFDPENPRLPLSMRECKDESSIVTWLLKNAALEELLESICQLGFFDGEPLLGYRVSPEKVVVVEGNRRLAAIKLFRNIELATIKQKKIRSITSEAAVTAPDDIPVIIYSNRSDIVKYLGYRHITGVQSWGALAKAKYLSQLRDGLVDTPVDQQFKILGKEIGSNANYVGRLLTSLNLYEVIHENDFFDINGLSEETINFSLLTTALSYSNISEFIGLSSAKDISAENLDTPKLCELSKWIYEKNSENNTRLGESRNLKTLSSIVKSKEGLAAFTSGESLDIAMLLTNEPSEIYFKSLIEAKVQLNLALRYIPHVKVLQQTDVSNVIDLVETLRTIHGAASAKVGVSEQDIFDLDK